MSVALDRPTLVIGLGCQRGCSAAALRRLIDVSLREHQVALAEITALASIDSKADETGLLALAEQLRLPIGFFGVQDLVAHEPQLSHRSDIAFEHTGCYGVAESAALEMASRLSGSTATLVIPRRQNQQATLALASGTRISGTD